MRNIKSTFKRLGRSCFALIALSAISSVASATPQSGSSVQDAQGQTIGTIAAPMESESKLSPAVIIQLNTGGKLVVPMALLKESATGVSLSNAQQPRNDSDAAVEMIFEIRSMTMALALQDARDASLLRDISEMVYDIQGDQLIMRGSMESINSLERVLIITSELSDLSIAPHISIRDGVSG